MMRAFFRPIEVIEIYTISKSEDLRKLFRYSGSVSSIYYSDWDIYLEKKRKWLYLFPFDITDLPSDIFRVFLLNKWRILLKIQYHPSLSSVFFCLFQKEIYSRNICLYRNMYLSWYIMTFYSMAEILWAIKVIRLVCAWCIKRRVHNITAGSRNSNIQEDVGTLYMPGGCGGFGL